MVTREKVIDRLTHFGFIVTEDNYDELDFEIEKYTNYVLNYCNITIIPEILDLRIIDRICAEFLFNKKNTGTLNGFNYDVVIKEIKEGDTTLKYATGNGEDTAESRFDAFVRQLERGFDKWITPHRRLRW